MPGAIICVAGGSGYKGHADLVPQGSLGVVALFTLLGQQLPAIEEV